MRGTVPPVPGRRGAPRGGVCVLGGVQPRSEPAQPHFPSPRPAPPQRERPPRASPPVAPVPLRDLPRPPRHRPRGQSEAGGGAWPTEGGKRRGRGRRNISARGGEAAAAIVPPARDPPSPSPPPTQGPPPGTSPPTRDRPKPPPGTAPNPPPAPPGHSPRPPPLLPRLGVPLPPPPLHRGPPPPPPHGELPEGGEDRGGHLRRRVQGPEQGHGGGGGPQKNPPGHGDRGRPQHRDPRDLPAEGAQPPQHRQAAGRDPHGEQALPGVRVPAPGPEEVHGLVVHQRHRPPPHQELLVPAAAGPGLLPRAPRAAPRPQAPEPAHQRRRRHQIGRFRPGPRLRGARAHLHPRGGDTLVPSPRDPAGLQVLLDGRRHLELGLHLRRDDHPARSVPRGLGDRPALPHLPHAGDAGRGGLARGHGHARLQAQLPQVGPAGLRQSGAAPGRGGTEAAGANAALRPQQADLGQGGAGTPLLPRCHQGCPPPAAVRGRGPPLRPPPAPACPHGCLQAAACSPARVWRKAGGGVPPVPPSRKEPPSLH